MAPKESAGADLVIPLLALGFAAYFFWSIVDLVWEAKANGVVIGTVLVALVLVQLARIGRRLARGEADLRADALFEPRDVLGKRIGMVLVTIAFIALLQVLGLTLALFIAMAAGLRIMGVRRPARLLGISFGVAAAAYLLFIVALETGFPHGFIEKLFS